METNNHKKRFNNLKEQENEEGESEKDIKNNNFQVRRNFGIQIEVKKIEIFKLIQFSTE
jgi:hypothetical protein